MSSGGWRGYAWATVATGLALLVRLALQPLLGSEAPFATAFGAVAFVALHSGFGPAVLAALLGYAGSTVLFVVPSEPLPPSAALGRAVVWTISVAVIVAAGVTARRERTRADEHARDAEVRERQLEQEIAERQATELRLAAKERDLQRHVAELGTTATRLRDALQAARGCVMDRDLQTGEAHVSENYSEITGFSGGESAERILEGLHPDDRERYRARVAEALARTGVLHERVRFTRPDTGALIWVEVHARVTRDADGRPVRMGGLIRDVTAQEAADRALRESEERFRRIAAAEREARQALEAADRRKDEFLATLAHELRNPLAPILNAVSVLQLRGPSDPELVWNRDVIQRQTQHMGRLLDDLLDVSRITRNTLHLRRQRIALDAIVAGAVETARPVIDAGGHTLSVVLPSRPVVVDGDPLRLAQVFANLLNNAAKYTDRGGAITVTAVEEPGRVVVSVRDSGIGIAPAVLPTLFEMFAQAAPALERAQGGLGIGLALVRGIVELHGGRVEARSDGPGKGSEFVVTLPTVAVQAAVPAGRAPADRPRHALGALRVVVADDSRDAADTLSLLLTIHGAEVRTGYDGHEAVALAAAFHPDVVLLDLGMPRMNGYEAAAAIRATPEGRDAVLVAVTGWGQDEDRRRTAAAGFDLHLTKPVDPDALAALLADLRPRDREVV
jgi:PAS domain S-box-containing protein